MTPPQITEVPLETRLADVQAHYTGLRAHVEALPQRYGAPWARGSLVGVGINYLYITGNLCSGAGACISLANDLHRLNRDDPSSHPDAQSWIDRAWGSLAVLRQYLLLVNGDEKYRTAELLTAEGAFPDLRTAERGGMDYHRFYVTESQRRVTQSAQAHFLAVLKAYEATPRTATPAMDAPRVQRV